MKTMLLLGVVSLIVLLSRIASSPPPQAIAPLLPPIELVSSTNYDIDVDNQDETIEIVLVEGRRYIDEDLWCGRGDKWEGQFAIQVRRGSIIMSYQSLNDLMGLDQLTFRAPEFQLVLQDYNQDGRIDFNLGQYAACNWHGYNLFTVNPDGRVAQLDGACGIISAHDNSTSQILIESGLVGFEYYTQDSPSWATKWYAWDGDVFALVKITYSSIRQ